MPRAAQILFVIGLILAFASLMSVVVGVSGGSGEDMLALLMLSIPAAINAAVLPWIGAALVWRADKFLEKPE